MLGLWYRLHGKQNEAKACFRTAILEGIGVLTDENPYNDIFGYNDLAIALLKAGDRANAMTAAAFLLKGLDRHTAERAAKADASHKPDKVGADTKTKTGDEKGLEATEPDSTEPAASNELENRPRLNSSDADRIDGVVQADATINDDKRDILLSAEGLGFPCDGKCMRYWVDITAVYICEICLNVSLCDACFKLVKAEKLPFRICNPDHSLLQVYPLPEKPEEVASIEVDEKTKPHQVWLDKLKKEGYLTSVSRASIYTRYLDSGSSAN